MPIELAASVAGEPPECEDTPFRMNSESDPVVGRLIGGTAESLLLNLDASLHVHRRGHLFSWTQGLMQGLIPHRALIYALRVGEPMSFRADGFSTVVPDGAVLGDLLLRDAPVLPGLIAMWKERSFRPIIFTAEAFARQLGAGPLVAELTRIGAVSLLAHGSHDVHGEVTVWVVVHDSHAHRRHDFATRVAAPAVAAIPELDFADAFEDLD